MKRQEFQVDQNTASWTGPGIGACSHSSRAEHPYRVWPRPGALLPAQGPDLVFLSISQGTPAVFPRTRSQTVVFQPTRVRLGKEHCDHSTDRLIRWLCSAGKGFVGTHSRRQSWPMARKRGVLHACSSFPCDSLPYKLLTRFYEVEQRLAKKKIPQAKGRY